MSQQRRSRNAAFAGMFCVMTLSTACLFVLQAERTLSRPSLQAREAAVVRTQFRVVPEARQTRPGMRRILAENSAFEISEPLRPEVKPEPAVKDIPVPEEKEAKPKMVPKPKNKTERVSKKKPVSSPKPVKNARELKAPTDVFSSVSGEAQAKVLSSSGTAAASAPEAAGSTAFEEQGKSAALAAVLQAVEKYKQYPRQARRSGAAGTCVLKVHISSDGRVDSCTLAEGSGRAVLDAAATRLGERLVGLNAGGKGGFTILVPVRYRLSDR